jgi:hypothetical protein
MFSEVSQFTTVARTCSRERGEGHREGEGGEGYRHLVGGESSVEKFDGSREGLRIRGSHGWGHVLCAVVGVGLGEVSQDRCRPQRQFLLATEVTREMREGEGEGGKRGGADQRRPQSVMKVVGLGRFH